jgi:hypothetical protein
MRQQAEHALAEMDLDRSREEELIIDEINQMEASNTAQVRALHAEIAKADMARIQAEESLKQLQDGHEEALEELVSPHKVRAEEADARALKGGEDVKQLRQALKEAEERAGEASSELEKAAAELVELREKWELRSNEMMAEQRSNVDVAKAEEAQCHTQLEVKQAEQQGMSAQEQEAWALKLKQAEEKRWQAEQALMNAEADHKHEEELILKEISEMEVSNAALAHALHAEVERAESARREAEEKLKQLQDVQLQDLEELVSPHKVRAEEADARALKAGEDAQALVQSLNEANERAERTVLETNSELEKAAIEFQQLHQGWELTSKQTVKAEQANVNAAIQQLNTGHELQLTELKEQQHLLEQHLQVALGSTHKTESSLIESSQVANEEALERECKRIADLEATVAELKKQLANVAGVEAPSVEVEVAGSGLECEMECEMDIKVEAPRVELDLLFSKSPKLPSCDYDCETSDLFSPTCWGCHKEVEGKVNLSMEPKPLEVEQLPQAPEKVTAPGSNKLQLEDKVRDLEKQLANLTVKNTDLQESTSEEVSLSTTQSYRVASW